MNIWSFSGLLLPLASPMVGCTSEKLKYIWFFARFVLPLQMKSMTKTNAEEIFILVVPVDGLYSG
jgi:hypothetical protein